jgi:hypothetical protein
MSTAIEIKQQIRNDLNQDPANPTQTLSGRIWTGWNLNSPTQNMTPLIDSMVDRLIENIDIGGEAVDFFDPSNGMPEDPELFSVYIASATANGCIKNYLYEWNGLGWNAYIPKRGTLKYIVALETFYFYNGTDWAVWGSQGLPEHNLVGSYHSVAGLTAGQFLKALSSTSFGFAAHGLTYTDVGAQPVDATLTALAALDTTTGFLFQTGTDTFTKYGFGNSVNTVCQGNDSRLSDARTPTAHGLVSASHTVSGLTTGQFLKALSANTFGFAAHSLTYTDVGAQPVDATLTALAALDSAAGFLFQTGTDTFTKYGFGNSANTVCQGNDSRLSDSRTPTAHGLVSASHTVSGLTTGQFLKALSATTFGFAAHGLTYTDVGAQPLDATLTALAALDTAAGFLFQTGADTFTKYGFGNSANTLCQGNDTRLSDARTPTAHGLVSTSHTVSGLTTGQFMKALSATTFGFAALSANDIPNLDWSKITTGKPSTLNGYGIIDAMPHIQNNITVAAAGWYRIAVFPASLHRGWIDIDLYTTGGSYYPRRAKICIHTTNSVSDTNYYYGESESTQYWDQFRVTYDSVSGNKYLEVHFKQALAASFISILNNCWSGYDISSYSGALPADSGTTTVIGGAYNFGSNGFTSAYSSYLLNGVPVNTGSGTTNKLPKYTNGASAVLGDSLISDDGSTVSIGGILSIPNTSTIARNIQNLNHLSGTPSAQFIGNWEAANMWGIGSTGANDQFIQLGQAKPDGTFVLNSTTHIKIGTNTVWDSGNLIPVVDKNSNDWNLLTSSYFNTSPTNSPENSSTIFMGINVQHNNSSNYNFQIAGRNDKFAVRTKNAGTWQSWRWLWHDGNFNPNNYWHNDVTAMTDWNPLGGTKVYGIKSVEGTDYGSLLLYRQLLSNSDTRLNLVVDGQMYCGNEGTPFTGVYKVWHAGNLPLVDPNTPIDGYLKFGTGSGGLLQYQSNHLYIDGFEILHQGYSPFPASAAGMLTNNGAGALSWYVPNLDDLADVVTSCGHQYFIVGDPTTAKWINWNPHNNYPGTSSTLVSGFNANYLQGKQAIDFALKNVTLNPVAKVTGHTDGSGNASIDYPSGFTIDNTNIVSVKAKYMPTLHQPINPESVSLYSATIMFHNSNYPDYDIEIIITGF